MTDAIATLGPDQRPVGMDGLAAAEVLVGDGVIGGGLGGVGGGDCGCGGLVGGVGGTHHLARVGGFHSTPPQS